MLFHPGADRQDIGIKNDVLRRESGLLRQQCEGSFADPDLFLARGRLPLLVEGHHDHRRSVASNRTSLLEKFGFALFHTNRIDNPFAVKAL